MENYQRRLYNNRVRRNMSKFLEGESDCQKLYSVITRSNYYLIGLLLFGESMKVWDQIWTAQEARKIGNCYLNHPFLFPSDWCISSLLNKWWTLICLLLKTMSLKEPWILNYLYSYQTVNLLRVLRCVIWLWKPPDHQFLSPFSKVEASIVATWFSNERLGSLRRLQFVKRRTRGYSECEKIYVAEEDTCYERIDEEGNMNLRELAHLHWFHHVWW